MAQVVTSLVIAIGTKASNQANSSGCHIYCCGFENLMLEFR